MLELKFYFEMSFIYSWCVCWRWWLWPSLLLSSQSFLISVHLSYLCSRARNRAVLFLADLFIPPKETGKMVLGQCWGWWTPCPTTPSILVLLSTLAHSQSARVIPIPLTKSNPSPRLFHPPKLLTLQLLPPSLVAVRMNSTILLNPIPQFPTSTW